MARLSHVALIITMNALMCVLAQEQTYPKQYDIIDINSILHNDNVLEKYHKCFMDATSCKNSEMKRMTEMFGEAIQTKCKKCTEKQKEMVKTVSDWCRKNRPDKWQEILAKIGYKEEELEKETYPKSYDVIDVNSILQNDNLRKRYHKCFMNATSCKNSEMKRMTEMFGEAIQTGCEKCTEKQKEMVKIVSDWCREYRPDKWQEILAKIGYEEEL